MKPMRAGTYVVVALMATQILWGAKLAVDVSVADRWAFALGVLVALPALVLGAVVASRRPAGPVGLLLALLGATAMSVAFSDLYTATLNVPADIAVDDWFVASTPGSWMLLFVPPALLLLLFPDGEVIGRRWRIVTAGLIVVPLVFNFAAAADPNPFPDPYANVKHLFVLAEPYQGIVSVFGFGLLPVFLALLVASATSMVIRYRRSADPVRRAQLKWFALGAAALPGTLLLAWADYLLLHTGVLVLFGLAATYVTIPVAVAVALLRHDLYDVDRAISATVTYGLVTTILLAFYVTASFIAGVDAGRASPIAAAAATAVCAAALAPLRSRLQRLIDRRLYPVRQATIAALEELRRRTHEGAAEPEELEAVLRGALRDPALRVGYHLPGRGGTVDGSGTPLDYAAARIAPIRLGGTEIGVLVRGEVGSRELLNELAAASALIVEVVRLRIEVSTALAEAETSRARLLHAGYEERRRMERDLHDGAQQRLVTLGMSMRIAQRHLGDGSIHIGHVDALLDEAVSELAAAVAELRQIAHGLRPSSLDDGLDYALTTLASKLPFPVTLDVRAPDLPDDVAMTAYYVASEAVTNAVKHASPATIGVRVHQVDGRVTIQVSDDGSGGARVRPGAGLAGLADRVAAAGGLLRVVSPLGSGTMIEAVLPCAS